MKLYEITEAYSDILAAVESGEIPEDQAPDLLDHIDGEWEGKARAVAAFILNLRAESTAIADAATRMAERKTVLDRKADYLARYLQQQMIRAGKREISTPEFVARIKRNPGKVVITDPALVPENLMTKPKPPEPKPDLRAIKQYLNEDRECEWASIEISERLELK